MANEKITSFIENMCAGGQSDDAIEEMLKNAGHSADAIAAALGTTSNADTTPASMTEVSSDMTDPIATKPATPPEQPTPMEPTLTERTTSATIIKRGSGHLRQGATENIADGAARSVTPHTPAGVEPNKSRLVIHPRVGFKAPALTKEDSESTSPTRAEQPKPESIITHDSPPTPIGPELTPVVEDAVPEREPTMIYPEAHKGSVASTPTDVAPVPKVAGTVGVNYPDYPLNLLELARLSVSQYIQHLIPMLGISMVGAVLGVILLYIATEIVDNITELTPGFWFWLYGAPRLIVYVVSILYNSLIYGAIFGVFLAVWRAPAANMAYDIAMGLRPNFLNSMAESIRDFWRHYFASAKLAFKLVALYFTFVVIFSEVFFRYALRYAFEGGVGLEMFRIGFTVAYAMYLLATLFIIARNIFVNQLMLNRGDIAPMESAKQSVELIKSPRNKYAEVFGWTMMVFMAIFLIDLISTLAFNQSVISDANVAFATSQPFIASMLPKMLVAATFLFSFTSIYEIGSARIYAASKGIEENSKPLAPVQPLSKYIAIGLPVVLLIILIVLAYVDN